VRDADDPAHALTNAASVAVSPDGRSVVAASYGEDALELFARDPDTGELTRLATAHAGVDAPTRLRKPLGVAFSPSGSEVYAAAADPGSLVAFDVSDALPRAINAVGSPDGYSSPQRSTVSRSRVSLRRRSYSSAAKMPHGGGGPAIFSPAS